MTNSNVAVTEYEIDNDDSDQPEYWAVGYNAAGEPVDDVVVASYGRAHSDMLVVVRDAARDRWPDAKEIVS